MSSSACSTPSPVDLRLMPHEAAARIPAAVDRIIRREAVTLEAARAPGFDVEKLKQAMADQAENQ